MTPSRSILNWVGFALLFAAVACTYDFERFDSPGAAGSGGGANAGSPGSGGGTEAGAGAGGSDPVGVGGASAASGSGGEGGGATGEGGGAGFSCVELGGILDEGHCYFTIAPGTGLVWASARSACESYSPSSHLATITSSAEQAVIEGAFTPSVTDYWIGLSLADIENAPSNDCDDAPESCPFEWVTGDTPSYVNWAAHSETDVEPNYTGACVRLQLDGFAWADFDCATRLPALCEHDG